MITVYGITHCDTCKKSRAWLSNQGLDYRFHDFKKQGVPEPQFDGWLQAVGWEKLVNRQGTTWRKLEPAAQAAVQDAASAKALMLAQPSVIKRPVLDWGSASGGPTTVGFDAAAWAALVS